MWGSVLLIAAAAVAVLSAVVAIVVVRRRRRAEERDAPSMTVTTDAAVPSTPPDQPHKSGLESALDEAMDRAGRPIREAIDAGTEHVDQLRSLDDSGPLLGRALDRISADPSPADDDGAGAPDPTPGA